MSHEVLDLRGVPCPANSARALIVMETMGTGEKVEIWVDDGEPIENLPPSLTQQGHVVLGQEKAPEGFWRVTAVVSP